MIGIDTNILVRYLINDDPRWSPIAATFVNTQLTPAKRGYINPITLVELVWILRRRPEYNRAKLAQLLEDLLASDSLVVGEAAAVERALIAFKNGGAGFADDLIAELNEAAGASPTVTIDHKAGKTFPSTPLSQGA